jgi:hypothetical protein
MHFQRNTVFVTLRGSPQWNGNLCLRSIHETEDESFNMNPDNTALVAVLLSIKHNSSAWNARAITMPHGGSSNSGRAFNQLKFYNGNIRYDRIFMFGDLNTPGKCFVIIKEHVTDSNYLLTHMRQSSTVGDIMALIEPKAPTKALNDMQVINTITPLVTLAMPNSIPFIPPVMPQPGQQQYFYSRVYPSD